MRLISNSTVTAKSALTVNAMNDSNNASKSAVIVPGLTCWKSTLTDLRVAFRSLGAVAGGASMRMAFSVIVAASVSVGGQVAAEGHKFVGVGSCSSSNCHGSVTPLKGSNVLQNEYVSWQRHDLHSKAYINLTGADGKRIAENLGIANPEKEKECLDCHATNAPAALRDTKFQLEDGVGCESCHGAAGGYLESHAGHGASHQQNLDAGMTDIVSPVKRAALCVSCHLGNEEKAVTHRLIGAGHPRLSFEVDTFSMIEPKHWVVDDDYRQRKGEYVSAKAWLAGQIANANNGLKLVLSDRRSRDGIWPEFTLMYCYTCHHSLTEEQWKVRDYGGRPGELSLNTSAVIMVREAMKVVDPSVAAAIDTELSALHTEYKSGKAGPHAKALQQVLDKAATVADKAKFGEPELKKVMKQLAVYGATTPHPQYELAEQVAMALQSIASTLAPDGSYMKPEIDGIYEHLKDPRAFQPDGFTAACDAMAKKIKA